MIRTFNITRRNGTKTLLEVKVATRQRAPKYRSAAAGVRGILNALRRAFPETKFRVEVR